MSDRRIPREVEVHSFLDPDLEPVLEARKGLSDPDKWIQGRFGKGQRKCWAGHLLKAGARDLDREVVNWLNEGLLTPEFERRLARFDRSIDRSTSAYYFASDMEFSIDGPQPEPDLQKFNAGLMGLVDLWERIRFPRSFKARKKTRLCIRRFIELVGDMEPSEVTRSHVMAYRDALEKLPGMSAKNIGEHLSKLHVLFNVALSEGVVATNPAHIIKARGVDAKLATRRQGFTSEQVRAIFHALSGETETFGWIVRLLAYHGTRSGEVCQLRCDDVTTLHGVPVVRIHDRHGHLKNRASVRDIPIHPACTGIVTLAEDVIAIHGSDSWLFHSLPAGGSGRESWFQRYEVASCVTRWVSLTGAIRCTPSVTSGAPWPESARCQKAFRGASWAIHSVAVSMVPMAGHHRAG